jgi:hypothetical protein
MTLATNRTLLRFGYAALGAALVAAAAVAIAEGAGWGAVAAGALGPDIALLLGIGTGLEPGQLHPRAVPLYNALHRFAGPAALAAAAALGLGGLTLAAGAAAWGAHVAIDRSVGYGLRTADGFQRA